MYTINTQVFPSCCNEQGDLKMFSAFQMMQDCSELWQDSEPYMKKRYEEEGRAQLLASRQVEILRVPHYGEKLTVTTSVWECQPLFGFRNTIIRDEEGKPCYVTWSMGAFVDRKTGRLKKLDQELIDSITYDEKFDMEYKDRRIILPKEVAAEQLADVPVTINDIDYNHHVNNAHYIRIACEYLPEGFQYKSVRIEWKLPARLGDTITVNRLMDEDTVYFNLTNQTGKVCTILEFE